MGDHDHGEAGGHSHAPVVTTSNERRLLLVFWADLRLRTDSSGGRLAVRLPGIDWPISGHMISERRRPAAGTDRLPQSRANPPMPRALMVFIRIRVLAALANGASLLILVIWIGWESHPAGSIARLRYWPGQCWIVAVIGLLVEYYWRLDALVAAIATMAICAAPCCTFVGDLLGSVAAIAAAIGIMLTGWTILDPLLSILVALLGLVRSAWGLVTDSIPRVASGRATRVECAGGRNRIDRPTRHI